MRTTTLLGVALLLAACAKKEDAKPAESAMAAPAMAAPAPTPAPFSLSDAAGKWDYVAKTPTGDTVLVHAVLTATADPDHWTLLFKGRTPVPLRVTVSGDSAITVAGPYESVLRKGVMVTTNGSMHMTNGKLVGHSVAHYATKSADSVRHLIIEATRKP